MQNQTLQKVASDYKKESGFNQTLIWITIATTAVLLLGIQQKTKVQAEQAVNLENAAITYTLVHTPAPGPSEE